MSFRFVVGFISSVFLYFLASGGGGLAAINTQADFQHKAVEESWRAWVSVVRNQPDAPKWIQSDNAKFEESIVGYIPKVLADATVGRGRFASDRLKKNEVILLDHDPKNREYSGANWNSTVFLNFVAGTYLMNFDIASGKPAYLIDDAGVENVGKTLQEQLFKKYNADYTGQIARAVSDVKIYANRLNLYNFISSMCDIKNSKMPVPEEINAAKLPDLSNYLAPNCSGWFDELSKIGEFSFEAYISGNHDTATKYATAHINHGHFLGYALENWDFVNLDRDMRASFDRDPQVICTYNLPKYISELSEAATHRIFQYKGKTEFEANCLRQNQVHGLANLGNTCWFNTALQTLHFSPTFRRALSKIVEADLQDVPKDKLTQTKDSSMSYQLLRHGSENWYLPLDIIHYKGRSTVKTSFRYVRTFYKAMLIFFVKHYLSFLHIYK